MGAHNLPPIWIGNAGLIWSMKHEHIQQHVDAISDSTQLPPIVEAAQKRLSALATEKDFMQKLLARAYVAVTSPTRETWLALYDEQMPASEGQPIVDWGNAKISDLKPALEEINTQTNLKISEHAAIAGRLSNADAKMEIVSSDMAGAWEKIFGSPMPAMSDAIDTWNDGQGGTYRLFSEGRISVEGPYDGILGT